MNILKEKLTEKVKAMSKLIVFRLFKFLHKYIKKLFKLKIYIL